MKPTLCILQALAVSRCRAPFSMQWVGSLEFRTLFSTYLRLLPLTMGSLPDLSMCAHHLLHAVPIFFSWRNKQLVFCRRKCCLYLLLSGSYSIFWVVLVRQYLSVWPMNAFSQLGFSIPFDESHLELASYQILRNSQKFHLDPTLCIFPNTCTVKLLSALEHAMPFVEVLAKFWENGGSLHIWFQIDGQVSVLRSYYMKLFVSIKITTQNLPWLSTGSIFEGLGRIRDINDNHHNHEYSYLPNYDIRCGWE